MKREKHVSRSAQRIALLIGFFVAILGSACGPSEEDCQQLCDWASQVCTDNASCMDDCLEASSGDVSYALEQCPGRTPSTCKSANCCLRFTYEEYYWQQHCYQN